MSPYMVDNSSRCSYYYLRPTFQRTNLLCDVLTSVYRKYLYSVHKFSKFTHLICTLYRKFSCRTKYNCLQLLVMRIYSLQKRYSKRCCFSRSRLSLPYHILSFNGNRYSLCLNRTCLLKTHLRNCP